MLLLIEIGLTIWAWNSGWKWLALLPMGIIMIIGFTIGFLIGMNGGTSVEGVWILDLICIGILIFMGAKGRKINTIGDGTSKDI